MSDDLIGHSANRWGRRHALADHLRGTAALTGNFADVFGAGELAGYLGLVHDVGKGYCARQEGLCRAELTGGRVGIDHKAAGVYLAARVMPWQFSGVIEGHHGGLPAKEDLRLLVRGLQNDLPAYVDEAITKVSAVVPEVLRTAPVALPEWVTGGSVADLELLIRMTYSAMVDADFLDTAAHLSGRPVRVRADADMDALADRFEQRRKASLARRRPTPLDTVREDGAGPTTTPAA
ncbi:CRISPR-associated endonuclease Cas3'' [Streptomyces sp.]|uniref:CRISPR-associated endonuclease Cas3'' n=1 Tax=Streptomyces sp. TaxID=1931 RepID=UPI002D77570C|nr:CRISPR-associated endonuclease Cas3'' [Streptomyces sp.]HET6356489.1 CRISPR-associated endonuclease Cas3'' [Streptomyces sp.]